MKSLKGLLVSLGFTVSLITSAQIAQAQTAVLQPGPGTGKDIWTTSVYSYVPPGGGPGGGLNNEHLRVGGWGDQYYSLIEFDLTGMAQVATSARLELFSVPEVHGYGATGLYLDRVTEFGTGELKEQARIWSAFGGLIVRQQPNGAPALCLLQRQASGIALTSPIFTTDGKVAHTPITVCNFDRCKTGIRGAFFIALTTWEIPR